MRFARATTIVTLLVYFVIVVRSKQLQKGMSRMQGLMMSVDVTGSHQLAARVEEKLHKLRQHLMLAGIVATQDELLRIMEIEEKSLAMGGPSIIDALCMMELRESLTRRQMQKVNKALLAETRRKWTPKKLRQIEDRLSYAQAGGNHLLSTSVRFRRLLASWLMPDQAGEMSRRPVVYCPRCKGRARSHQSKRRGKQRLRCSKCGFIIFAVKRNETVKPPPPPPEPKAEKPIFEPWDMHDYPVTRGSSDPGVAFTQ